MAPSARARRSVLAAVVTLGTAVAVAVVATTLATRAAGRAAAACAEVTAQAALFARPVGDGPHRVVVLGDSYAAGALLPDPRAQAWTAVLAAQRGWTVTVDGVGGSGFTNGGACGTGRFADRAGSVLAAGAPLVLVQGGLNDRAVAPADLARDAADLLAALAPVPDVVVVGPPDVPDPPDSAAVDAVLERAAQRAGRPYVPTRAWPLRFLPDGVHLTAAGHETFAGRLDAALGERP